MYECLGSIKAYVRKPRLLESGNVIQFFVPAESPDSDLSLMLGRSNYSDCQVAVTLHLIQDSDGKDKRRRRGTAPPKKYGAVAQMLYKHGFFNAPQVQTAIGTPDKGETGQSAWGVALAKQLGGDDGMGSVDPAVVLDWAERHGVDGILPKDYVTEAQGGGDTA